MHSIETAFNLIVWFSLLACVLLGVTDMLLQRLREPLERIRLIQLALLSLGLLTLLGLSGRGPEIRIPMLSAEDPQPADVGAGTAPSTTALRAMSNANRTDPSAPSMAADDVRVATIPSPSPVAVAATGRDWALVFRQTAVVIFAAVAIVQLLLFALGAVLTSRLTAAATEPTGAPGEHIRDLLARLLPGKEVRVLAADRITVPMVHGIVRPTILLPQRLVAGEDSRVALEHCLAHECKHIEQHDLLTWNLLSLCQTVLWPQPSYWRLKRELRVNQDHIADAFAASRTGDATAYAETLVGLARRSPRTSLGGLTMAGSPSNLRRRTELLLSEMPPLRARSRKRLLTGAAALLLCAGIPIASVTVAPAADEPAVAGKSATPADRASAADSVEHSGTVYDLTTNAPIAGVTVIVTRMNSGDWSEIAVTESTTDANGKYTFTIPPEQLSQKLLYLMFDLRHDNYAPTHCGSYSYSMVQRNLSLGADPWFTKLYTVPGVTLTGRLVDEQGQPVAGAEIRADTRVSHQTDNIIGCFTSAVSADDGRFSVSLPQKGPAGMSIIPRDHCMQQIVLGDKREPLGDIRLTSGHRLRGQVIDADGKPVPNVWVNVSQGTTEAYEVQRSSKTDEDGNFETRPVALAPHYFQVEMKATGAIEKEKYANFHDDPTPVVFVPQVIDVTEKSLETPVVIQAVPHVEISGQCVDSKGEPRAFHPPEIVGKHGGAFMMLEAARTPEKGGFQLKVPRGMQEARLNFITNEHSALTVQLPGKPMSPQTEFVFPKLETDITGIKVVRYVAPILLVTVIDEQNKEVTGARLSVKYSAPSAGESLPGDDSAHFEGQGPGVYRSGSLCPGIEFVVKAETPELEGASPPMTMAEGANDRITLTLKAKLGADGK